MSCEHDGESCRSEMPSSCQLLSDHSPSRRLRRSSLAGLYSDCVGGVADASSSRHEYIGYYEIVLIGCCVCSPSSFILESPPVDVKRSCCACACCFVDFSVGVSANCSAVFSDVIACVPFAGVCDQLSICSSDAPVTSLCHDILRGDSLITEHYRVDELKCSMRLGGILSILEVVYREVMILSGPCACVDLVPGSEYGWRLCSCDGCVSECGVRRCDIVALPHLAGFSCMYDGMSSEHVYDIVYPDCHVACAGAAVGSFMWAACLAGCVHSSLSSLPIATLFRAFSAGYLAVYASACHECDGSPSNSEYDGSECGSDCSLLPPPPPPPRLLMMMIFTCLMGIQATVLTLSMTQIPSNVMHKFMFSIHYHVYVLFGFVSCYLSLVCVYDSLSFCSVASFSLYILMCRALPPTLRKEHRHVGVKFVLVRNYTHVAPPVAPQADGREDICIYIYIYIYDCVTFLLCEFQCFLYIYIYIYIYVCVSFYYIQDWYANYYILKRAPNTI